MDINELVEQFRKRYEGTALGTDVAQFNVLDEMHANENAHTRVLVRLLQIPFVCKSFVEYIASERPDLASRITPFKEKDYHVDCFSEYIDARIYYDSLVFIIENKVKDAVDQDAQIDRYVESEMTRRPATNIYVIYLTKDGGKKVSEGSFKVSREILGFESAERPGRFIELNYKNHIINWLENRIYFSIADTMAQPYLRSGIQQYVDYLKGPELLNIRERNDPYAAKLEVLRTCVRENGITNSVVAFTQLYKDYLRDQDPALSKFIELMREAVSDAISVKAETDGPGRWGQWNSLECSFGHVDHRYYYVKGYALQLTEGGYQGIRAIEVFPQRGVQYSEALKTKITEISEQHPSFSYWWNGRSVYKFPVVRKDEAISLCEKLKSAIMNLG